MQVLEDEKDPREQESKRLPNEALNQGVCHLKPAVHDQGDADRQTLQDLLVLGLLELGPC